MIKTPCTLGENEASMLIFGIGTLKALRSPNRSVASNFSGELAGEDSGDLPGDTSSADAFATNKQGRHVGKIKVYLSKSLAASRAKSSS